MTRAVVAGGAGFLGSNLCEQLLARGWWVTCVDSMITGRPENLDDCTSSPRFRLLKGDVAYGIVLPEHVDWIYHLASPASPKDYRRYPIDTLKAGALATLNLLDMAMQKGAGLVLASTSEVYGDPLEHPQSESYWGNVNPVGPRSVYDEAKRFAEAAVSEYGRTRGVPVRIARIFNTFGPRMRADDGRAVPTFIHQALTGGPITVHGDGSQTRTLCYVADLIAGLVRLTEVDVSGPVNLGGTEEIAIRDLADRIRALAGSDAEVVFVERPVGDPTRRCPDISRARFRLDWKPSTSMREGLETTIAWFRARRRAEA